MIFIMNPGYPFLRKGFINRKLKYIGVAVIVVALALVGAIIYGAIRLFLFMAAQ